MTHPRQDPNRRCMPVEEWPHADRRAWIKAITPGDVLEDGGIASHWCDYSQRKNAKGYGRWLTWLECQGLLLADETPQDRVTRERVVAYIHDLSAINAKQTILSRLQELDNTLSAMAPSKDCSWIRRIAARVRARRDDDSDKRRRIRTTAELFERGICLMDGAKGTPLQQAVHYRDGLMVAMLAARPLRRKNFAAVRIDKHLIKRENTWWLAFAADEVKNRQPIEVPLPSFLTPYLNEYLARHRPVLTKAHGRWHKPARNALWVSKDGSPMTEIAIYFRINKRTEQAFGTPINMHLFRDCAATSIAIEDPAHVRIAASLLGHTSLATSERYYNQAGSIDAARQHQNTLLALRKSVQPQTRRS